ncbi:putative addiction module component (TIGR02574 family) [Chromohalobacter marismortui]|uniref:Putative addiction module component (TIGR02574 family) n=1 Tax=Chromohalobacter marismortui TaxID=42055 RepID=A0A4R7NI99_9GAMM|nr:MULTISPECIES: addiction module protein [Chromohalobacter]MCI0510948.1 addiction module protein [Chromohalobacter sp.]MCI0592976.1 addiction module protein [Chromohalobacter sp.]TDU20118.1 putative addiction module component (TIGR02574 family) [Chromohalobacter marismortui]
MNTETLDHLRSQISTLSESERAALARELIMSLDGPRDDSVEQAWNDEIVRRVSKVKSGKATLIDREEFRSQMRARLGQ